MFGTDLALDYEAATSFGLDPRDFFDAGLEGALCDDETKSRLRGVGDSYDWDTLGVREGQVP
jgi:aminodeoxyfutalosine deaminase